MMPSIDVADVRTALTTRTVLDFYGWKYKRESDEFMSAACPQRSDHSRRALVINANSGRWRCFPCATSGDLFDFIAGAERLSIDRDFQAVLAKAAEIAGVGPSQLTTDERNARRAEWERRRVELELREREERKAREAAAVPTATAYWNTLVSDHERGVAYLRERGVADVLEYSDIVRFDPKYLGSPALALWTRDGEIRNVIERRVPELGEPKTPGLYQCPSAGTLINALNQIERGRDIVITEGVMDSITAFLAFLGAIVLGAHGADNLPKIAKLAAPEIAKVGARLIVVPHADRVGYERSLEVCRIAVDAGLSLRKGSLIIAEHGQKDLNDAWRNGWRPAA
jgi:hypothetical protein